MTSAAEVIRANGLGASEIAAVVGISPYGDAWQVYATKKGLIRREQTEEMFWGKQLEPVIARVFATRMGVEIEWCDQRIAHSLRPWQFASPDAFVLGSNRERTGILECKTASLHNAGEWDRERDDADGVPDYYVVQVQWQMSVCGLTHAYVAVLIAGNDFRIYRIDHDPVLEEILVEDGEAFFRKHLMAGEPPPIGGSELAREYLKRRYPREREKLREATPDEVSLLNEYATLRDMLDGFDGRRDEMENELKIRIGEAEGLTWGENRKLTWKKVKDHDQTDWEKVARKALQTVPKEEQAALIAAETRNVIGYRTFRLRRT